MYNTPMKIAEPIYGAVEITDPVILELMDSDPVKRLKGIAQYGVPDPYYHLPNFSRFEHSLGVMLMLRLLGASVEEQIAGLLHDVSHTAFSHIVDWVVGSGLTESYQDDQHAKIILSSSIPQILLSFGFIPERIVDYHHYGLLERDAPDICADRFDYALREIPLAISHQIFAKALVKNNQIVMADKETAVLFGREYLKLQMDHWGGFEAASRYRLFANMLRLALEQKIITMDDFDKDDAYVISKLLSSSNQTILHQLEVFKLKSFASLPKSDTVVHKKFRYLDPLFIDGNKLTRASDANPDFKAEIDQARQENALGIRIPKIAN
jgi:uncharacterized protein